MARVLIVEDSYLIASALCDHVEGAGHVVLGPAADVRSAMGLLARERPDVALLDVKLQEQRVDPLAEALVERGTPIVFVTGYPDLALPPRLRHAPMISKPADADAIATAIDAALR